VTALLKVPADVPADLAPVIAECERVTRERARNFWYGLKLTPGPARGAMYVIYAWMREADDLADAEGFAPEERVRRIAAFRAATDAALAGTPVDASPIWRGLAWVADRHELSQKDFHDMLDGQLSDVGPATYESWDDLRGFCYRVASTVGLVCIRIWGYHDPEAPALAVDRGIAFQLTNILRDIREDHARGRCYLPADELAANDLDAAGLVAWRDSARCARFMQVQCARAERIFVESAPLDAMVAPDAQATIAAMSAIYRGILRAVARDPARAMRERARLGAMEKSWIALRARLGLLSAGSAR